MLSFLLQLGFVVLDQSHLRFETEDSISEACERMRHVEALPFEAAVNFVRYSSLCPDGEILDSS